MKKLCIPLWLLWFVCSCGTTQSVVTISGSMPPSIITVYEIDIQRDGVLANTKVWQAFQSKKNTRTSLCRINMHTVVKPYPFYLFYDSQKAFYVVMEDDNKGRWKKTTYQYLHRLDGESFTDHSMVICFALDPTLYTHWYVSNTPQLTLQDIYRTEGADIRFLFMTRK